MGVACRCFTTHIGISNECEFIEKINEMRNSVIRHGSTNAQPIRISARLMLPFFPPSRHLSPLVVSLFHIFLSICAGNGLMRRDYTRCCDMRKHLRGKDRTIKSRVISRSQEFARGGLQLLTNALR